MKPNTSTVISLALLVLATLPAHAAEMKNMSGMKDMPGMTADAKKAAESPAHKGQGTVNSVDVKAGKLNLTHGPIASLNWPGMTMDFRVRDKALLKGVTPGQKVEFDIVQQGPGQFVITRITPAAKVRKGP